MNDNHLTPQEFQPESSPVRSIKQLVEMSLTSTTLNGKSVGEPQSVDELLQRVFQHIEAEALQKFKSNQLWAIRAWTYDHILTDAVSKAAAQTDEGLLDELVQPIAEWQQGGFDPLTNFRNKLVLSGRKAGTICEYIRWPTLLVTKFGKKVRYTEGELIEFLTEMRAKHPDNKLPNGDIIPSSTYANKVMQFKLFLESLPEDEKRRRSKLPFDRMPALPTVFEQPIFSNEEIDILSYTCLMHEKPENILRFAIACIYGCRVGELAMLTSQHINLNPEQPTINIPTEKRGRRVPQPILRELLPLFAVPLQKKSIHAIEDDLRRIVKKAGVVRKNRMGIHSIRRAVVTALYEVSDLKELSIRRFLRWSDGGGGMGVMPRYVRKSSDVTDGEVLARHPFTHLWTELVEFLPYLPKFDSINTNAIIL